MKLGTRIADIILQRYKVLFVITMVITLFFLFQMFRLQVHTVFEDLLPQEHGYVKLHNKFRKQFGGANSVVMQLRIKEGTLFTRERLEKIRRISDELQFLPAVDRYKVVSIGTRNVRDVVVAPSGLTSVPLYWDHIPATEKEMDQLIMRIQTNDTVWGRLVSFDEKAALIYCDFFEEEIDYDVVYGELEKIRAKEQDENTEISIIGSPMVFGFVHKKLGETLTILGLTLLIMMVILFVYTRDFQLTILPMVTAIMCAIWGVGFCSLMGYVLDPIILVVPLLITARALSHSVQFNERFVEEYEIKGEVRSSVHSTVEALFVPGLAGIITDAFGILTIAYIAIPLMKKLGIVCFFWAMSIIVMALILNPIILLFLPGIKKSARKPGVFDWILDKIGKLCFPKMRWIVVVAIIIVSVLGYIKVQKLIIGDTHAGSPLLWPDSTYNKDAATIDSNFGGTESLLCVFEGNIENCLREDPSCFHYMDKFQMFVSHNPNIIGATSIVSLIKNVSVKLHEDYPKWGVLPDETDDPITLGNFMYIMKAGANPGDFDRYYNADKVKDASISIVCRDHRAKTIKSIITTCKDFLTNHPSISAGTIKLGGGVIGTSAAINEVVARAQVVLLILAYTAVFLLCSISFRSIVAGIVLMIPLAITNLLVFAYMVIADIGLTLHVLPVASIAVGIGVDYGIYLFGRMKEEFSTYNNYEDSAFVAIKTTGKAITFTALTIVVGVALWIFSSIKFQAEMGLLLLFATLFHLILTLIVLPSIINIIKPKFIRI